VVSFGYQPYVLDSSDIETTTLSAFLYTGVWHFYPPRFDMHACNQDEAICFYR
jgi:hypothetical protein